MVTRISRRAGILILLCAPLFAGTLTVTVKDPAQALVGDAAVNVTAQSESAPRTKPTDTNGRAIFEDLPPGTCTVSVTKQGFATWEGRVTVGSRPATLAVVLKLSAVSTSVRVTSRRSPLANSDPNYQALRTGRLSQVFRVSNLVLNRDAGTFTFRSGSFSFLPPVLGHVTTGVFLGDGNFELKPQSDLAATRLKRMMKADSVNEDFSAMVVFFSDGTFDQIKQNAALADESTQPHEEELKRVRSVIQTRREPSSILRPMTMLERALNFEDIPNYDAEILAELYNGDTGERNGSFRAFLRGKKHADLRFLLNPHGAMPVLHAPEEVALLNFDPNSDSDGVWYLAHTIPELQLSRADARLDMDKEEKRLIAPEHYKIETVIGNKNALGNQPDLTMTCDLRFHPLKDGVRMVKLDLVPDLQVSRVNWNGNEIPFVQENRSHDGSFYLQLPEALAKGRAYDVTFEYAGGGILQSWNGNVPARRVWYPTPVGPASRATYDLTFRIPHGSTIVTVGNQVSQSREGAWDVSQWTSDVPITQAVFRWMEDASFKTALEETTNTRMSLYLSLAGVGFIPPSRGDMLIDVGNSLRIFNAWFGKSAYDNIAVMVRTGGPYDSLPGLVYAPPIVMGGFSSAFSQTQVMSGGRGGGLPPKAQTTGLDEAFPRLMAGQWWGNTVSPASFHDEWLSAGLVGFSASVYDAEVSNGDYKDRWANAREQLLSTSPANAQPANDAGPVWMGLLNDAPKTPAASGVLNSAKGAYIVQMLRSLMWDRQGGDSDFQAMLQDFIARFANRSVSSQDFQSVVEKHMKPAMDPDRSHTMNWFFDEWLYGTDVPTYRLEYSLKPGEKGGAVLDGKLTQSGVSPSFCMVVPIFGEFPGRKDRIGQLAIRGNSTHEFKVTLPQHPKQILLNINHDILTRKDEVIPAKTSAR